MTSTITLTPPQSERLKELHEDFDRNVKLTGCCVTAASFLIVGALIVIGSACLCLTLPGVNAMQQVVLPAILPGVFALILSIPLILLAINYNRDKNEIRKEMIETIILRLDEYNVPEMERKQRTKFILNNFFKEHWSKDYRSKLLSDIKDRLGKDKQRNPRQEKIAKALDEARQEIYKKKK